MMDVKVEIPQWIPASEKMPEEYAFGDYWVTVLRYDGNKDTIVSEWGEWSKAGSDESHWAFDWLVRTSRYGDVREPVPRERVLAWLPLPEAYMLGHEVNVESNSVNEFSDAQEATWLRTKYNKGDDYFCSCCKEERKLQEIKRMRYCPNCGRKMRIENGKRTDS